MPPSLEPRPLPEYPGEVYRDSLAWADYLRSKHEACEADKAAAVAEIEGGQ